MDHPLARSRSRLVFPLAGSPQIRVLQSAEERPSAVAWRQQGDNSRAQPSTARYPQAQRGYIAQGKDLPVFHHGRPGHTGPAAVFNSDKALSEFLLMGMYGKIAQDLKAIGQLCPATP